MTHPMLQSTINFSQSPLPPTSDQSFLCSKAERTAQWVADHVSGAPSPPNHKKQDMRQNPKANLSPLGSTHLQSALPFAGQDRELTRHNANMMAGTNGLKSEAKALFQEINTAKKEDLKAVHTQGHWVRDMRGVSYLHQWIDRAPAWMPATALGVAALIIAATATTSVAIAATAGVAAIAIPLFGILVTAKAWTERESSKNQLETQLTNIFRSQRSALLTTTPEENGAGKTNEFSRNTKAMNTHIYTSIRQRANRELRKKDQPKISDHEMSLAQEFMLGSKVQPVMTPCQGILFQQKLPNFVLAMRSIKSEDIQAHDSIGDTSSAAIRAKVIDHLKEHGCDQIQQLRYSEKMLHAKSISILEPLELNEREYADFRAGKLLMSKRLSFTPVDKIISIKKVNHQDKRGVNSIKYRIYASTKMVLTHKNSTKPLNLTQDHQTLFSDQVKRAMLSRAEITRAGHGTDDIQGIFSAINDPESILHKPGLSNEILADNHYLQNWGLGFENQQIFTDKRALAPDERLMTNLNSLDKMNRLSTNEYDYLLMEKTGSRDPLSTVGTQPNFISGAALLLKHGKKHQASLDMIQEQHGRPHSLGHNLPFKDKLNFSSTHCAPMHSHDFFLKLDHLDMVDYQGINHNTQSVESPLSRKAMIKIFKSSEFQKNQYYSEFGLGRPDVSKRRPSFGPVEENNSKSILSSVKRFNSSRELMISLGALFKQDMLGKPITSFDRKKKLHAGQPQWNSDTSIRDMTHALNVTMIHTEIRKLEASLHDLSCTLKEYESYTQSGGVPKSLLNKNNPQKNGDKHATHLDTIIFQKKIKVLISEVADQMHNLFKTQIDYQIAYAHKDMTGSIDATEKTLPFFSSAQQKEMKAIGKTIKNLTKSQNLQSVFQRSHNTILNNRGHWFGGGPLSGFQGRARLPFAKQLTFKSSIRRLLGQDTARGIHTISNALGDVTHRRLDMEKVLATSKTLVDMNFLEALAL